MSVDRIIYRKVDGAEISIMSSERVGGTQQAGVVVRLSLSRWNRNTPYITVSIRTLRPHEWHHVLK